MRRSDETLDEDPSQVDATPDHLQMEIRLAHVLRRPRPESRDAIRTQYTARGLGVPLTKASPVASIPPVVASTDVRDLLDVIDPDPDSECFESTPLCAAFPLLTPS